MSLSNEVALILAADGCRHVTTTTNRIVALLSTEGLLVPGSRDQAAERMARYRWERARVMCEEVGPRPHRWEEVDPEIRQRWIEREAQVFAAALGEQEGT